MRYIFSLILLIIISSLSYGQIEIPSYTDCFYGFDNWFDINKNIPVKSIIQVSNADRRETLTFEFEKRNVVEFTREYSKIFKSNLLDNNRFYFDTHDRLIKCIFSGQFKKGNRPKPSPIVSITYDTLNTNTIRMTTKSISSKTRILDISYDSVTNTRNIKSKNIDSVGVITDGYVSIVTKFDSLNRIIYEKMIREFSPVNKYIDEFNFIYENSFLPTKEDRYFYGISEDGAFETKYSLYYFYILDGNNNWIKKIIKNDLGKVTEIRKRNIKY